MKAEIDLTVSYPYPPSQVWEALTSSDALATWLMPNDFQPVVGHHFSFRTAPQRLFGFDGTVRCEVLELDPPRRMVWSWAGGSIDTTVTFTLEPAAGDGTTLRMCQVGFHGLGGQLTRRILASGWPGLLGRQLQTWLDQHNAAATRPDPPPSD